MADGLLEDQLVHPGEVRRALAFSPRSLDRLDAIGVLPKIRIEGLGVVRYRLSDVLRLIGTPADGGDA